uniref:Uncharacterized protein n=1 Tax=Corethron hystrix TaxID=216773 RepID=A0A7S1BGL3_9STRA|mmetsp:Transcript_24508/g.55988  ORF Transcript_24508/g.55988 Transcript_24508/m.55988 type:complete len:341 (+) Transcript_24508:213-1235(+)
MKVCVFWVFRSSPSQCLFRQGDIVSQLLPLLVLLLLFSSAHGLDSGEGVNKKRNFEVDVHYVNDLKNELKEDIELSVDREAASSREFSFDADSTLGSLSATLGAVKSHLDHRDDIDGSTSDNDIGITSSIDSFSSEELSSEDEDERTLLDVFGDVAKDFFTKKVIPETDPLCKFDIIVGACVPQCSCAFRPLFGDYHADRSCRLRHDSIARVLAGRAAPLPDAASVAACIDGSYENRNWYRDVASATRGGGKRWAVKVGAKMVEAARKLGVEREDGERRNDLSGWRSICRYSVRGWKVPRICDDFVEAVRNDRALQEEDYENHFEKLDVTKISLKSMIGQ